MNPGQDGVPQGEGFGVDAGEHGLAAAVAVSQGDTQQLQQALGEAGGRRQTRTCNTRTSQVGGAEQGPGPPAPLVDGFGTWGPLPAAVQKPQGELLQRNNAVHLQHFDWGGKPPQGRTGLLVPASLLLRGGRRPAPPAVRRGQWLDNRRSEEASAASVSGGRPRTLSDPFWGGVRVPGPPAHPHNFSTGVLADVVCQAQVWRCGVKLYYPLQPITLLYRKDGRALRSTLLSTKTNCSSRDLPRSETHTHAHAHAPLACFPENNLGGVLD